MKKLTSLIALVLAVIMLLCACGGTADQVVTTTNSTTAGTTGGNTTTTTSTKATTDNTTAPVVTPGCVHTYEKTVITQVTTKTDGKVKLTCTKCGETKEEVVPAVTSISILAIGNSFSVDAMEYLGLICEAAGIEEITLGNLYIGGCSLDQHLTNAKGGGNVYTYYQWTKSGGSKWTESTKNLDYGLMATDWDYITIQQVSQNSGMPSTYGALNELLDYVLDNHISEDPKIYWHMTWAYQQNSGHAGFANYDRDQTKMYNAIVSTVQSTILTNANFDGVIPSGTAIQNLRTSYAGDTLTRDGYHLTYDLGRYTAALLWFKTLTGLSIDDIAVAPESYPNIMEHLPAIKEAVNNAVATPYAVTESTHKEFVNELLVMTDADKAHLTSLGLDPAKYEVLDLGLTFKGYWNSSSATVSLTTNASNSPQYFATKIFNEQTLPVGSVVNIADGFQYRPEGWVKFGTANSSSLRPGNYTNDFIVDETFYATFPFRAFNIAHVPVDGFVDNVVYDDRTAFRIYVPIAEEETDPKALTEADKAYLVALGLDPNNYEKVALDYTLYAYYNSTSGTTSNLICLASGSTANNLHNFIGTRIISKSEIPVGSIIRLDAGYQYRPERFITLGAKPAARGANITTDAIVVDDAWWGSHNYVGFNVAVAGNSATVHMETGEHFVIYALKDGKEVVNPEGSETPAGPTYVDSKNADEVFAALGYDASKYTKLEVTPVLHQYYVSTEGTSLINDRSNRWQFWATQKFSKDQLPNGTVIIIGKGYQYRPEGWQTANGANTATRPGNVTSSAGHVVVVDDAWWGDYNYRAFNVAVEGASSNVSANDYVVFAIYVPKA